MNEIYPPKMSVLLSKCTKPISRYELTLVESWLLSYFDFDLSFSEISYSYLANILAPENEDKLEECERLLRLAITELKIMKLGEENLALGIIYLVKPSLVREWKNQNMYKIKSVAKEIYSKYIDCKNFSKS